MSKIKEVLVLHHSHLDVGYTHAQPVLLEMQKQYIDQALELCAKTEDRGAVNQFRWTCEASYPVLRWLETAEPSQIEQFKHFLHNGQLSLSASYLHMTPLVSAEQMAGTLYPAQQLRNRFGIEIKTAIHHDVNGQPWSYSQMLLDAGVEFFIMGINIHMGAIPFARPSAFHWETPDRRKLLSFNGEHYSLFSQICNVNAKNTDLMAEGLNQYLQKIEDNPDYPFDFVYLTATNLPLYDNNPPDQDLADLIAEWNSESREQVISFVTPEQLLARVRKHERELPTYAGDWTDYWNFGSGSSAKETKLNRRTKQGMKAAALLEAFQGGIDESYHALKKQAWEQINLYDEHTWGAFNSVADPDHLSVDIQWAHKAHYAYQGNSLTGYLLGSQMEKLAGNPLQSDDPEGLMLVNYSSVPVLHDLRVPASFRTPGRHLSADRMRQVLMNNERHSSGDSYGIIELPPFSWHKIPFDKLRKAEEAADIEAFPGATENLYEPFSAANRIIADIKVMDGRIESPYHRLVFDPVFGKISSLYDKQNDWEVIDASSPWSLFQYVQETIDTSCAHATRKTIFPRDVEKGNNSISCWNHDWPAARQSYSRLLSCRVERGTNDATLVLHWDGPGVEDLEQRFTLFSYRPEIEIKVSYKKQDITTPEGTYFATPLNLGKWQCVYDTAGQLVELDKDQLPGVCRDFVTVDKSVSVFDGEHGVTLVCQDAPLVQVGDFNFGREHKEIDRSANPLLLAWPMNNYWETNFRARQPGFHSFTYQLSTFRSFEPADVALASTRAVSQIYATPVIDCKQEQSGQFIQFEGDGVQIFDVKPAEEGSGIVVRLSSVKDEETATRLVFPGRRIAEAYESNVVEERLSRLAATEQAALIINLEARSMKHLLIVFEDEQKET
ncbi:glycosyl hydrolase-related protein [Paenibacillus sp. NPDC058174]|uniref:glycoside hydrolase family 38 N-terminal domain-containing protein n=1 Tax=Paenibacillus sp. NPDC058174 TaxID=3346366 RepID=UPI0036D88F21